MISGFGMGGLQFVESLFKNLKSARYLELREGGIEAFRLHLIM